MILAKLIFSFWGVATVVEAGSPVPKEDLTHCNSFPNTTLDARGESTELRRGIARVIGVVGTLGCADLAALQTDHAELIPVFAVFAALMTLVLALADPIRLE